jgi:hypothetical protein
MRQEATMRKVLVTLPVLCALVLILALPAAAAKPMEVSGEFGGGATADPVVQAVGSNCFLTIPYAHVWGGEGAFYGSSIAVWEIVSHGACIDPATGRPYPAGSFRENLKAQGTFTGGVCDGGVWQEGKCEGGVAREGGFTFVWVARVRPADTPAPNMFGQITIMHGTGGLQGLHGTLETEGRAGESGGFSGQIHFEPQ